MGSAVGVIDGKFVAYIITVVDGKAVEAKYVVDLIRTDNCHVLGNEY